MYDEIGNYDEIGIHDEIGINCQIAEKNLEKKAIPKTARPSSRSNIILKKWWQDDRD